MKSQPAEALKRVEVEKHPGHSPILWQQLKDNLLRAGTLGTPAAAVSRREQYEAAAACYRKAQSLFGPYPRGDSSKVFTAGINSMEAAKK